MHPHLLSITDLAGHFHPVLVHLPLGILLLGVFMQMLSRSEKFKQLAPAIPFVYLVGCVTAILSCITGWLLASGGGYDEATLLYHRWMGIGVAIVSSSAYYYSKKEHPFSRWLGIIILLMLIVTGHLGGTLTHGEGYLTKGWDDPKDTVATIKQIAQPQEALVYQDIIQPVLQQKCYSCHGATKQKGGLRIDGEEWIMKGGKNGAVVKVGDAGASELYKRVILDPLEEKHMPPRGKPQLTERDRILLHWWISAGLNFNARAKQLPQNPAEKAALASLQQTKAIKKTDVPELSVDKAPDSAVGFLQRKGIAVFPVFTGSNYLAANFVTLKELTPALVNALLAIKDQLIWLKMPGIQLTPKQWKQMAALKNLVKLQIDHSNISDTTIANLSPLEHLQYLNIVATNISVRGLLTCRSYGLMNIYLAQTRITQADTASLKRKFTKASLEMGGYTVETLVTDTALLRKK